MVVAFRAPERRANRRRNPASFSSMISWAFSFVLFAEPIRAEVVLRKSRLIAHHEYTVSAASTAMLGVVGAGVHIVLGLAGTVVVAVRVAVAAGVGLAAGFGFLVRVVEDRGKVFVDLAACAVVLVAVVAAAVVAVVAVAAVVAAAVVGGLAVAEVAAVLVVGGLNNQNFVETGLVVEAMEDGRKFRKPLGRKQMLGLLLARDFVVLVLVI